MGSMPLANQLEELTTRLRSLVPAERLVTIEAEIQRLKKSGLAEHALKAGQQAPEFELPDGDGMVWRSADLRKAGALAVVFYRGRWCAYCNTQLAALQKIHSRITSARASLVAISPQTQKHSYMTRDMHRLRFPVLSDQANQVARRFGLVYRLAPELQKMYEHIYTRLPGYNGDASWELPLAATYVIGSDGTIRYSKVNSDWRLRPEPEEIQDFFGLFL